MNYQTLRLTGDFRGNAAHIGEVARSGLEVFAHNVECVERLSPQVRDRRADYRQSLSVLERAKVEQPGFDEWKREGEEMGFVYV
eukprot:gene4104-51617_t